MGGGEGKREGREEQRGWHQVVGGCKWILTAMEQLIRE